MKHHIISYHTLRLSALFAFAALFAACQNDTVPGEAENSTSKTEATEGETVSVKAVQGGSRVGFDQEGVGFWQQEDTIGVWSDYDKKYIPFVISDGVGTSEATFTAKMVGKPGTAIAVYPYNEKHEYQEENGELIHYFPSSYTFTHVDTEYSAQEGSSVNMPMYGTVDSEGVVSFRNYGSVIALRLDRVPTASGTITITSDAPICGYAKYSETDKQFHYEDDAENTVTIHYQNAEKLKPAVFYLPVLPGQYLLKAEMQCESNGETLSYAGTTDTQKSLTVGQNTIKKCTIRSCDFDITIDGHSFVDLGLESGTLWATTNLGAKHPISFGGYYSWGAVKIGETKEDGYTYQKSVFTWDNYEFGNGVLSFTKYSLKDHKLQLDPEDDAAYVNWGASFRMPTGAECNELMAGCNALYLGAIEPESQHMNYGIRLVSKANNKSIDIPCAGYYGQTGGYQNQGTNSVGEVYYEGSLWASTLCSKTEVEYAQEIYIRVIPANTQVYARYASEGVQRFMGFQIRPVMQP